MQMEKSETMKLFLFKIYGNEAEAWGREGQKKTCEHILNVIYIGSYTSSGYPPGGDGQGCVLQVHMPAGHPCTNLLLRIPLCFKPEAL